jgi:hypothetical protein
MEKLTTDKLKYWQDKYTDARNKYSAKISEIQDNREAYEGTRKIKGPDGKDAKKQTTNTRKVCFELVETQVDTNIPYPKVVSKDGYEDQATTIEMFLKNEIERLPITEINDIQGRTTPTDGGSIFYIEWDNTKGTRKTSGEIALKNLDTTQVTPQPGVFDIDEMDYIFIQFEQTRNLIKEKYGVEIDEQQESGDASINEDLLVHVFCFYKNKKGGIGLFSYVGDTVVQDYPDYFARQQKVCVKCGEIKKPLEDKCVCGSEKFELKKKETEKVMIQVPQIDPLTGQETMVLQEIEIPYYVPNFFPIVIRKNVSKQNEFLGASDITYIKDQQNDLAIYGAKIKEKMLKGGSIITKPKGVHFKANDEELKIIDLDNPAQLAMIEVKNVQPDVSKDLSMLETNYTIARQTIGITDTYQGRQDPTATSGKAKEIAAAQAAGRLTSKRKMKDAAFAKLYEYMFKFMLAYADEPRSYSEMDNKGQMLYKIFDKKDFILQDKAGNYYYNDEFIFTTDVSSTLSNNREAMWQETRMNFATGAYGSPQDISTLVMFWNMMNILHYPGAKQALNYLEQRKIEAEMIRQQEMIAKQIQDSNVESIMTRNKLNELDAQNQIQQLKQAQTQQGSSVNSIEQ